MFQFFRMPKPNTTLNHVVKTKDDGKVYVEQIITWKGIYMPMIAIDKVQDVQLKVFADKSTAKKMRKC